jgi:DNA-binding SARP family transcriptional activator
MLELRLLGALDLRGTDGRTVDSVLRQPKRAALLAYLAAARPRGFHRRDTLLALFWPELDDTRARNALNTALRYLRVVLGTELLLSRGAEEVVLSENALWCDTEALEKSLHSGRLEDAIALYRGDMLDGFHIGDAPGFEEWLEEERARLRALVADAARTLAERCAAGKSAESAAQAVTWARRVCELAPDDEGARRRLIRLLDACGDRGGALRVYDDLAVWLEREFGTQPAAETQALMREVRSRMTPGAPPAAVPPPIAPGPREPPLVALRSSDNRPLTTRRFTVRRAPILIGAMAVTALAVTGVVMTRAPLVQPSADVDGDADVIAVLPFRVTATDSSYNYLREGSVDLLSAQLRGGAVPRAVDSRTTLNAWQRAVRESGGELSVEQSVSLAQRLGATRLLLGEIVVTSGGKTAHARMLDVPSGKTVAEHEEHGAVDELVLVDRLVAGLLAQSAGEGESRLPDLSDSLSAVKSYLAGMRAFRGGESRLARQRFDRALEIDSSFAVAALWQMLFDDMSADEIIERTQHAWNLRNRLSVRDRALLLGQFGVGPNYPKTSSMAEYLAAAHRAARLNPDRAEVWYDYGSDMVVHGPQVFDDWRERAAAGLDSAIALDSTFGPALRWRLEAAFAQNDKKAIKRYSELSAAANPRGDYIVTDLWLAALALDDKRTLAKLDERLEGVSDFVLSRLNAESALHGLPLAEAERAIRHRLSRPGLQPEARNTLRAAVMNIAAWRGRVRDATASADSLGAFFKIITLALTEDGYASAADAQLQATRARSDTVDDAELICYRELWRVERGDTSNTRWAIDRMRRLVRDYPPAAFPRVGRFDVCPRLLGAMLEHVHRTTGSRPMLDSLDAVMLPGPGLELPGAVASMMIGRWRASEGNYRAALIAIRRRPYIHHPLFLIALPGLLREEGRLATLVGDSTGAIRAYRHFLTLRDQPDPGIKQAEVLQVEAALAALTPERH